MQEVLLCIKIPFLTVLLLNTFCTYIAFVWGYRTVSELISTGILEFLSTKYMLVRDTDSFAQNIYKEHMKHVK